MEEEFEDRLRKDSFAVRDEDRALVDRNVVENRELSDDERLEMFRMQMFSEALPNLPNIPGWHCCWLTTNHGRDTIQSRLRLGYVPLTAADVPHLEYAQIKTGEYAGLIAVNEMLAFKLPDHLYQMYMREAHHNMPRRQEEKLSDTADMIKREAEGKGFQVTEFEGNADLREEVAAPRHFG